MRALKKTPNVPANWNYRTSVRKMKAVVWKWKSITVQMVTELWTAHEALARQGSRTDLDAKATKLHTWESYCDEIGLNRVTAWRWLQRFDPASGKLQLEDRGHDEKPRALAPRHLDPDAALLRSIMPRIEKMNLAHRLRVAARVVFGR